MEKELPELFATAVLPDFQGCALAGSSFGMHIEVLVDVGTEPKAVLIVERPDDGMVPLLESLESLEYQLNTFLDGRGMLLSDSGNPDWN
jgi:hypothetical protein